MARGVTLDELTEAWMLMNAQLPSPDRSRAAERLIDAVDEASWWTRVRFYARIGRSRLIGQ